MAKIFYLLKQNKNTESKIYGKWFAQAKAVETMNTRKLANHIAEHGSIYTPDVVFGVLEKFRSCMLEMLMNSRKVKIDGLGTFYCTIENQKGGAATKQEFSPNSNLKALHIRFLSEQTTEENISSRQFLKQAEFISVDSLLLGNTSTDTSPNPSEGNTSPTPSEGGEPDMTGGGQSTGGNGNSQNQGGSGTDTGGGNGGSDNTGGDEYDPNGN